MRLLVSVRSAAEALAALAGGADLIDAKDPSVGALGAVSSRVFQEICELVGTARPVTAALGDANNEAALERMAHEFVAAGAALVKIGFAGSPTSSQMRALIDAAVRGARSNRIVAVAYADGIQWSSPGCHRLIDVAADAGATGILLDTADKSGPGVRGCLPDHAIVAWVGAAHRRGLLAAIAGKLTLDDLPFVRGAGADIAGVRSAACVGGRTGAISADQIRLLRGHVDAGSPSAEPSASVSPALTINAAT
jgi:(5-formylfuran-3-yl)methyl phosphate synthase